MGVRIIVNDMDFSSNNIGKIGTVDDGSSAVVEISLTRFNTISDGKYKLNYTTENNTLQFLNLTNNSAAHNWCIFNANVEIYAGETIRVYASIDSGYSHNIVFTSNIVDINLGDVSFDLASQPLGYARIDSGDYIDVQVPSGAKYIYVSNNYTRHPDDPKVIAL